MKDLKNKEDFELLKKENFSIMMFWADGCHVCDEAKPQFEALQKQFKDFTFYKTMIDNNTVEFYKRYEEEKEVEVTALDEDGDEIVDAKGNKMTRISKRYDISIPKYYVFNGSESNEEDEYGLLGKVEGHNLEQLTSILTKIQELHDEQSK